MSFTRDRIGPVDHGILDGGENQLKIWALSVIPNREKGQNVNFSFLALVPVGADVSVCQLEWAKHVLFPFSRV